MTATSRPRRAGKAIRFGYSGHRGLHGHLVVLGVHAGVFASYNTVLAVVREPSPWRYLLWGIGLAGHALYVYARARAEAARPGSQ